MNSFKFPTNIKQIGSIESGLRIYVEDYVCSYLQQYTSAADYDERLAILVGKYITIDKQQVIFISGAILGKYCILENDIMIFSDKSYDYILEQIDNYFKDFEIVGWMQSQPGYGTFLNPKYENYHIENFRKPYQVLFVMDPIEKLSSFYTYNQERDKLLEMKGYFIYYEKNHSMHEYMLENRIIKNKMSKSNNIINIEHKYKDKANYNFNDNKLYNLENRNNIECIRKKDTSNREILFGDNKKNFEDHRMIEERDEERYNNFDKKLKKISRSNKNILQNEKNVNKNDQRRIVNMLVSMCGVMFLICFILGTSLIRSEDRITGLEKEIDSLVSAYNNVSLALQNTQEAFASQKNIEIKKDKPKLIIKENKKEETEEKITQNETKKEEEKNKELEKTEEEKNKAKEILKREEEKNKAKEILKREEEKNKAKEILKREEEKNKLKNKEDKQQTFNEDKKSKIPTTYKVQQGDNLTKISIKFYGNKNMIDKIMKENNMTDPEKIFYGKVLNLPKQ